MPNLLDNVHRAEVNFVHQDLAVEGQLSYLKEADLKVILFQQVNHQMLLTTMVPQELQKFSPLKEIFSFRQDLTFLLTFDF